MILTRIYTKNEYFNHLNDIKKRDKWRRQKSRFTLFVGAGFSMNFGMPGWNGYASEKLKKVKTDKSILINHITEQELQSMDKKHLLTLINGYLNDPKDNKKYEKEIFKSKTEDKDKHKHFIDVFKNVNASFVTTNYDNILEDYFDFYKKDNTNFDDEYLLEVGEVFHIHGDINSINEYNFLVSTWKDYYRLYFQNESDNSDFSQYAHQIRTFLGKLFNQNEVLIIGYGLSEIEILKYIFDTREKYNNSNITIVVIKHAYADENILHKLYDELGLNTLFLDIDEKGYGILLEFLEELAQAFPQDQSEFDTFNDEDIL